MSERDPQTVETLLNARNIHVGQIHINQPHPHFNDPWMLNESSVSWCDRRNRKCFICMMAFQDIESFKRHLAIFHQKKPQRGGNIKLAHRPLVGTLDSVSESSPYSCKLCPFICDSTAGLMRHGRTNHASIRDHVCTECGADFVLRHHLKNHINAVHFKIKEYVCKRCNRAFASMSNLKDHERHVHLKEKNHVCKDCGASFSRVNRLKTHYKSHLTHVEENPVTFEDHEYDLV